MRSQVTRCLAVLALAAICCGGWATGSLAATHQVSTKRFVTWTISCTRTVGVPYGPWRLVSTTYPIWDAHTRTRVDRYRRHQNLHVYRWMFVSPVWARCGSNPPDPTRFAIRPGPFLYKTTWSTRSCGDLFFSTAGTECVGGTMVVITDRSPADCPASTSTVTYTCTGPTLGPPRE